MEAILGKPTVLGETVVSWDDEKLIGQTQDRTPRPAKRQGVIDTWTKSKARRSATIIGKAFLDERAQVRPPIAPRRAHSEIEKQPVFVSSIGIERKALITIKWGHCEPRSHAERHSALNEGFV